MNGSGGQDVLMRRLGSADLSSLGAFFERNNRLEVTRFFRPFPLNSPTAEGLLQPVRRDLFFGAELEGQLIAFSMLRGWDEGFEIPSFGIMVDYEKIGQGVGRQLSEWTLRWADRIGCQRVRLTLFPENHAAYHLYESLGFKETNRSTLEDGSISLEMYRNRPSLPKPVYVSTQCLPVMEGLRERLSRLFAAGLHHIEISNYPLKDGNDFIDWAGAFPGKLMLHHFFPPEKKSLVLNFGSPNAQVRHQTMAFFQRAVNWSAACGSPFYSVHAGYATDPIGRDEYGFVFTMPTAAELHKAFSHYLQHMVTLARYARERGVMLLVENNVLAEHHRGKLLLSTPAEFKEFLSHWPADLPVGILLDWGHWQVTACTLGADVAGFAALRNHVRGLHLHTNDGYHDQHDPFIADAKNLAWLRKFSPEFVTLEGGYSSLSSLQQATLEMEKLIL